MDIKPQDITDAVMHELQALAGDRVSIDDVGWVARELWKAYLASPAWE